MRSALYCPADIPRMMIQAPVYGADAIVFDLEDAVGSEDKDQARLLLSEFLQRGELCVSGVTEDPLIMVRINGYHTDLWKDDLRMLVDAGVRDFRLPKVASPDEVRMVADHLVSLEASVGALDGSTPFQSIIENPLGVELAFAIASASSRVSGLVFGAEDYCAATGIDRSGPVWVLDYPRGRIVNAAAACGLPAFDSVWSRLDDPAGLQEEAVRARDLGFQGKSVIHPGQIPIVNEVFTPVHDAIVSAQRIVKEYTQVHGSAASVDGRMVDKPVMLQAIRVLQRAKAAGVIVDGEADHDLE